MSLKNINPENGAKVQTLIADAGGAALGVGLLLTILKMWGITKGMGPSGGKPGGGGMVKTLNPDGSWSEYYSPDPFTEEERLDGIAKAKKSDDVKGAALDAGSMTGGDVTLTDIEGRVGGGDFAHVGGQKTSYRLTTDEPYQGPSSGGLSVDTGAASGQYAVLNPIATVSTPIADTWKPPSTGFGGGGSGVR